MLATIDLSVLSVTAACATWLHVIDFNGEPGRTGSAHYRCAIGWRQRLDVDECGVVLMSLGLVAFYGGLLRRKNTLAMNDAKLCVDGPNHRDLGILVGYSLCFGGNGAVI